MLVEKEIISPGQYWYTDQQTGEPRTLDVTPELTKYWHDQGQAMIRAGLTIPVPCEHDFNAHPMTPKERLLNNAGWVKEYKLKDNGRLFGVVDVQDAEVAKKLPKTIRWTSPWINSFTDGNGREWNNVISHLALTTRPRIVKQDPFPSIAAALSMATATAVPGVHPSGTFIPQGGICLSIAGRIIKRKDGTRRAKYPIAFSMISGAALGDGDMPMPKPKAKKPPMDDGGGDDIGMDDMDDMDMDVDNDSLEPSADDADPVPDMVPDEDPTNDSIVDLPPLGDPQGDVKMEELLSDLLQALGVPMPDGSDEASFKRHLYEATMTKIKELTHKGMNPDPMNGMDQPPNQPPNGQPTNPIIQEQQPMYMSLEDINKIEDPVMKNIALSMYNENQRLRKEMENNAKVANSLRDAKLKEAREQRARRCAWLGKIAPSLKADLDAMLSNEGMALSMGDGGTVIDPMAKTLEMLEKGLGSIPKLLTTETVALGVQPHPRDDDGITEEEANKLADDMARRMGVHPKPKTA